MAIADSAITSRRTAWACCYAQLSHKYAIQSSLGDPCAEETYNKMQTLGWALGIINAFAISTETDGEQCITEEFMLDVMLIADPGCVTCACPAVYPPVDPCTVAPNYTVLAAIPDTDVPLAPDGTYLLTSISGIATAVIATVAGGVASIQFAVNDGLIVYATTTTTFYSAFQNVTTLLYPGITVGTVIAPNLYDIISDNAPYAFAQNRDISIEAFDGADWLPVYTGTEQEIAINLTISTAGIVDNPTNFRIKYFVGTCQYGPVDATTFNTTPPFTNILFGTDPLFPTDNPITTQRGTFGGAFATADSFNSPATDGDVRKIRMATDDPNMVVAGARFGILRKSSDAGATWGVPAGNWSSSPDVPNYLNAQFSSIHYGGGGTFFFAGAGGILMRSVDYGATINYLSQAGLGGADVRCVAGLGTATDLVVGTLADGMWRSADAGATWAQILAVTDLITHIEVIGSTILAFTVSGVWRSTDYGTTWPTFPNTAILSGAYMGTDSSVIGTHVFVTSDTGRFRSTDSGQTWTQQSSSGHLAVKALSAQIVLYVEGSNNATYSANGGITTLPFAMGTYQGYAWTVEGYIYP